MKRDVPVVSYRNSTSNHNRAPNHLYLQEVVSYRNSTSNHNAGAVQSTFQRLYLIEILHQTTTQSPDYRKHYALYLIEILHQTTTASSMCASACSCILSKFYIKPQQPKQSQHRTASCILSKFYIKPQLVANAMSVCVVVSYRNSTSNHNSIPMLGQALRLYLIEILHQTTTRRSGFFAPRALYLIEILHQTTTATTRRETFSGCILSKFYIKPQQQLNEIKER